MGRTGTDNGYWMEGVLTGTDVVRGSVAFLILSRHGELGPCAIVAVQGESVAVKSSLDGQRA